MKNTLYSLLLLMILLGGCSQSAPQGIAITTDAPVGVDLQIGEEVTINCAGKEQRYEATTAVSGAVICLAADTPTAIVTPTETAIDTSTETAIDTPTETAIDTPTATQTKFSDESLGTRGNCMAACVASLLGIPIDGIPSWEDMGDDGSWGDSFMSFLESNGYEYEGMIAPRSSDWKSDVLSLSDGVDGYFIVGGKSPRLHTRGHAVIYKNGVMVHDPHPSGDGLFEIEEVYIIERNAQGM